MKMPPEQDDGDLGWLDQFDDLADQELGDGSACAQIHPVVEKWYQAWLDDNDKPLLRSSVSQAVSCLATEIVNNTPDSILEALMQNCEEDDVFNWIENLLLTGKAFQEALDSGKLDDL
jgi:hypothetical protein